MTADLLLLALAAVITAAALSDRTPQPLRCAATLWLLYYALTVGLGCGTVCATTWATTAGVTSRERDWEPGSRVEPEASVTVGGEIGPGCRE